MPFLIVIPGKFRQQVMVMPRVPKTQITKLKKFVVSALPAALVKSKKTIQQETLPSVLF